MSVSSIGPSQVAAPEEGNVVNGPAPAPAPRATQQSNEVGSASAQTSSSNSSGLTDGARAVTEPGKSGYEQFVDALNERLAIDPSYLEAKGRLDSWGNVEALLDLVDRFTGLVPGDSVITWANICAMADDDVLPNAEAKAAAQKLKANRALFNEMSGGKNYVTLEDARKFVEKLEGAVAAAKAVASEEVKAELKEQRSAGAANAASGQPGTNGASASTATLPPEGPKPPGSTKPGLDGAMENLDNMAAYYDAEIAKLTADPAKKNDPEFQKKFNELTAEKLAVQQLQVQLMQMMQNLAKMWSDVSRNAIQNMR